MVLAVAQISDLGAGGGSKAPRSELSKVHRPHDQPNRIRISSSIIHFSTIDHHNLPKYDITSWSRIEDGIRWETTFFPPRSTATACPGPEQLPCAEEGGLNVIWGFPKIGDPNIVPEIVGSLL